MATIRLFDPDSSPRTYDAIVVGSGISGGWAAKELCEAGLKTLVLERGRHVEHGDYPTASIDPWDYRDEGNGASALREKLSLEEIADYPKQKRTGYTVNRGHVHHFIKDTEHPYLEAPGQRFDWIRGYQTGGRSLVWGRQSYRWSDIDFEANDREGIAVDWPIRYADIAPYYDKVERYIGVSGRREGWRALPDGIFEPPMEFTAVEQTFRERTAEAFDDRIVTIGRTAHITGQAGRPEQNRQSCQFRNRCMRGCPYGAYFSSNASTLPAANATGNLTLRPYSIAAEVLRDEETGLATGVRVIDQETKEEHVFESRIVFLNASAIASAAILMNSGDWANESGQLGRNLMDHHFHVGGSASVEGFEDVYFRGRRPNGFYIPRFRNLGGATDKDFVRGYGYQGGSSRENWMRGVAELAYGPKFKDQLFEPGSWRIGMTAFGEMLPYEENRMTLLTDDLDDWGLPKVSFATQLFENEIKMRKDMAEQAEEIFTRAGFKNVRSYDGGHGPDGSYGVGLGIHEMGTARMGRDPRTSVLDGRNRVHACRNVYVTDGACMTSAACVNPSLTYMALTVRAVEDAVAQLNDNAI